jgi:hypothetical protein
MLHADGPDTHCGKQKAAGAFATCGDILDSGLSQPQVRTRRPKVKKEIPGTRGNLQTA